MILQTKPTTAIASRQGKYRMDLIVLPNTFPTFAIRIARAIASVFNPTTYSSASLIVLLQIRPKSGSWKIETKFANPMNTPFSLLHSPPHQTRLFQRFLPLRCLDSFCLLKKEGAGGLPTRP